MAPTFNFLSTHPLKSYKIVYNRNIQKRHYRSSAAIRNAFFMMKPGKAFFIWQLNFCVGTFRETRCIIITLFDFDLLCFHHLFVNPFFTMLLSATRVQTSLLLEHWSRSFQVTNYQTSQKESKTDAVQLVASLSICSAHNDPSNFHDKSLGFFLSPLQFLVLWFRTQLAIFSCFVHAVESCTPQQSGW